MAEAGVWNVVKDLMYVVLLTILCPAAIQKNYCLYTNSITVNPFPITLNTSTTTTAKCELCLHGSTNANISMETSATTTAQKDTRPEGNEVCTLVIVPNMTVRSENIHEQQFAQAHQQLFEVFEL